MTKIIFLAMILLTISLLNAQEIEKSKTEKSKKKEIKKIGETQAVNDKIEFKNSTSNSILTITDEGNNAASIELKDVNGNAASNKKLENSSGDLYWGGSALGSGSGSNGWTDAGSSVYTSSSSDRVGIGTTLPYSQLSIGTSGLSSAALYSYKNMNGTHYAGYFRAGGISGTAIYGEATNTSSSSNYGGYFKAFGGSGSAVYGNASGINGKAINGFATNSGNVTNYGGYFRAAGSNGYGVYGLANNSGNTNYGGYFLANGTTGRGVYGSATNTGDFYNYGGYFKASGSSGRGVYGWASNSGNVSNYGGYFTASGSSGRGVYGEASNSGNVLNYGGYFTASGSSGHGVYGFASGTSGSAVYGLASGSSGFGVYARALGSNGYAGYFYGRLHATGAITGASKSFKIDHPLDPTNKYLLHTSVESPDMKNIYDGTVTTDANGDANIKLPEWFEALNKDFRYQLTVIGEFAQAIVSEEINNNQFSIKTDKPSVEVSWQVTGIRHDSWANKNRTPVEEMKSAKEKGKYLHPAAYNMPETASVNYDERIEKMRTKMTEREKLEN